MSKEFSCLSYCTKWTAEGEKIRDVNRLDGAACFSDAFSNLVGKVRYKLIIHQGVDLAVKQRKSNCCFLNYNELRGHIRQLKALFPIKFKVEENKNDKLFTVLLEVDSNKNIVHKYILNWIRYAYEYPYNCCLLDAYRMRRESMFRFISVSNLFLITSATFPGDYGTGHACIKSGLMCKNNKELVQRINRASYLNNVYESSLGNSSSYAVLPAKDMYNPRGIRDLDFWQDPELYKMRLEYYVREYNRQKLILKKRENNNKAKKEVVKKKIKKV